MPSDTERLEFLSRHPKATLRFNEIRDAWECGHNTFPRGWVTGDKKDCRTAIDECMETFNAKRPH